MVRFCLSPDWSNIVYLILCAVDSSWYASNVCGFRCEEFLTLLGCVRIVKPTRCWEANVWPAHTCIFQSGSSDDMLADPSGSSPSGEGRHVAAGSGRPRENDA